MDASHYLGFDLSTQQLKGIIVSSDLRKIHEAKVDFDKDFGQKYGIQKGVLTIPELGEVFAPVALWLDAFDLVLQRLKDAGADLSRVKAVSGAGMQHGTVFWSKDASRLLQNLDSKHDLASQLRDAFSSENSPNWQDASTQKQCELFDVALGNSATLADITGSKAHHRFSGPQILRFRQLHAEAYENTARISLVSSFVGSILAGKIIPIDISDVCGMNLREIKRGEWNEDLLELVAGTADGVQELKTKLGPVPEDGGAHNGTVSPYFVEKYGFDPRCAVIACTGDNPSTLLAQPLREGDAIVSLGTSTTFLMSTATYLPHPNYHFMNHPTTAGLYMFMLCYKNGGLAREQVRDALNDKLGKDLPNDSWDIFNQAAVSTQPLCQTDSKDEIGLALYFPKPEIVPNVDAGEWRFSYSIEKDALRELQSSDIGINGQARSIIESQFLSLRYRSASLVKPQITADGTQLPAQPRRIYLVGGGSINPAIARIAGDVLGSLEGIFLLDVGGNACALGAAYKAVWAIERRPGEKFEEMIDSRWREEDFIKKVDEGYRKGIFEFYGRALPGFVKMEEEVIRRAGHGRKAEP